MRIEALREDKIMQGYHGRFLEVDLNNRTTRDLPLTEDFCKKYIGGGHHGRGHNLRPGITGSRSAVAGKPYGHGHRTVHRFAHPHGQPLRGGRDFTTHRLLGRGHQRRRVSVSIKGSRLGTASSSPARPTIRSISISTAGRPKFGMQRQFGARIPMKPSK